MTVYFPFLKLKQNEILCLGTLSKFIRLKIRPFFDFPRTSKSQTEIEILKRLELGLTKMKALHSKVNSFEFYLDNFDLDDDIELYGQPQYRYILKAFEALRPTPVLALDRNSDHNKAVYDYLLKFGGAAAVRLQLADIESWTLVRRKLMVLWGELNKCGATRIDLIIDTRVLKDSFSSAQIIEDFLQKFFKEFLAHTIIVTGSSIPSNIGELIDTGKTKTVNRNEFHLWRYLASKPAMQDIRFGDYGVVSPEYSDIDLDPKLFRTVSTPRAIYPFDDKMFVVRGVSFQSHPKGNGQYFEIAEKIESQSFFRKRPYSIGDAYIHDRSKSSSKLPAKAGSPGSWVKATLCCHITYLGTTL